MKLIVAVFLLSVLSSSSSIMIDCSYKISSVSYYTCIDISLDISNNQIPLTESSGNHMQGKTNADVKVIYLLSPKMQSLPQNVIGVFPNLKRYIVHGLDVQGKHLNRNALINGDFHGTNSLTSIVMTGVNLNTIKDNVFEGADNLDFLSLEACGIMSIRPNAFQNIPKLRSLSLNYNLLQELNPETFISLKGIEILMVAGNFVKQLHKEHFQNLHKLQKLSFVSNMLEEIDGDIINELPLVKDIYLEKNVCVDLNFGGSKTPIKEFKDKVKTCIKGNFLGLRSIADNQADELKKFKELKAKNEKLRINTQEFEKIDRDDMKAFLKLSTIKKQLDQEIADEQRRSSVMSPSLRKHMEFLETLPEA